jgi:hypothetical protein
VKVIKEGFGIDSEILGNCIYDKGIIEIDYPKEPEIPNIGLARHHLKSGYPNIWKLKEEAESESKTKLLEIEKIKNNFDSKIGIELEKQTETGTNLVRKDNYFFHISEVFESCYYNNLISELFDEIKMRKENRQPRNLSPGYEFPRKDAEGGTLNAYKLSFENGSTLLNRYASSTSPPKS